MGQLYPYLKVWSQNASLIFLFAGIFTNFFMTRFIYKQKLKLNKLAKAFLIFVVTMYIATIFMSSYFYFFNIVKDFAIIKEAIFKLWTLMLIFLSFYYPYSFINKKEDFILTLRILYISLIFLIFYGYIQVYVLFNPESKCFAVYMALNKVFNYSWVEMVSNYNLVPQVIMLKRIILANQEPSLAAFVLQVLFFPFLLSAIINQNSLIKYKNLHFELMLLLLSLPLLIFTFSTGGFVALAAQVGICVVLLVHIKKIQGKSYFYIPLIIIGVSLAIVIVIFSNREFYLNFENAIKKIIMEGTGEGSAETRYGTIVAGIKEFLHYPFFGVGLGNSKYFLEKFLPEWSLNGELMSYIQTQFALNSKSQWIRLLAEVGIIGIMPLVYFIFILSKKYIKEFKNPANSYRLFVSCSYIIFIVSIFVHWINVSAFFIIFQWALFGLFVADRDLEEYGELF